MKSIQIFLLSIVLLFIAACGEKVAFKAQEPLSDAALVYIYVSPYSELIEGGYSSYYVIRINNKRLDERVYTNEYIALDVKPGKTIFSATRAEIEEKKLTLNLEAGHIYYLRVTGDLEDGSFAFERVSENIGAQEIKTTGLSGSMVNSQEYVVTELVENDDDTKGTPSLSKTQEIEKAYALKEKGIISQKEFEKLKADILAK